MRHVAGLRNDLMQRRGPVRFCIVRPCLPPPRGAWPVGVVFADSAVDARKVAKGLESRILGSLVLC